MKKNKLENPCENCQEQEADGHWLDDYEVCEDCYTSAIDRDHEIGKDPEEEE